MNDFEHYQAIVPRLSELLLDNCISSSTETRNKMLIYHRASILINQIKKIKNQEEIFPAPEGDSFVTPQQMQCISLLIDFILKNPEILIEIILHELEKENDTQIALIYSSVIPSIYGFYSTAEHISYAFPFFCSLIISVNREIAFSALVPFYCSACTYKFTEYCFDHFVTKFVNDARILTKQISNSIIDEYVSLFIHSLSEAFPLLPHSHQFILRFMQIKGYPINEIIQFFIHRFAAPQLQKFLLSTPHKNQHNKLFTIIKAVDPRLDLYQPLLQAFSSKTIFEIPSAYQAFDLPFLQFIVSTQDADILVQNLVEIHKLPNILRQFVTNNYFSEINLQPLIVKVYIRKPKPVEQSYNWRRVVFDNFKTKKLEDNDLFQRYFLQIQSEVEDFKENPSIFLKSENLLPSEYFKREQIKKILSEKYDMFVDYSINLTVNELIERSKLFENYLVHSLALKTLKSWSKLIEECLKVSAFPVIEENVSAVIKSFSLRQLFKNSILIDKAIDVSAFCIQEFSNKPLQVMILIENFLCYIIGPKTAIIIKSVETRWQKHVVEMRPSIKLPHEFTDKKYNMNKTLLLNEKLWKIVAMFNSISTIPFSMSYFVFLDCIKEIEDLESFISADNNDSITKFALAFADSRQMISRFIIINSIFVKTDRYKNIYNKCSRDPLLWCRLESAILDMISTDTNFISDVLSFQELLIDSKFI
ncbi:hypothetical protein TVAG_373050 [Trichomonas vaginalis G3]|uniref:Uncharacterized protein n=1 Tax=Trichomonas vaginalis (strain ATCC PRA-98 / G3) TaxID=412133 RepID=A2DZG8_TRIV3|nr:hypothetical protein TVAGG3_0011590 [Trichomonas vaginalis G3]EAY14172.1 hypothetical protein TVAG_373050 [Trichomonas vaginalis G3]KAI5539170.1 hypothetical protein TVAGG3_0011590 [Trichomonas vaginalis G3]|eukprot:XP_001326395.1 hypothetical protein [Trichomonas vaginalis G3]